MTAVTIYSDFGAQENKVCHCFHCSPIYLPWSDGTVCHDRSFFFFFNFTVLYWFCHKSTWICHRYTRVPHPESSSLPVPSLWVVPVHQPQASSIVHRTWTGDSFHIWYDMFQCHSPKSSHPLPLPQSPQDCSIHQCLFCCLVYRVIVTIFLNSIYMH